MAVAALLKETLDTIAAGQVKPGAALALGEIIIRLTDAGVIVIDHPLFTIILRPA